ncbi:hypothetical protein ACTJJ7_12325 [Phyllobacterium sp. 22229]|uniref:Amidohydrolase 3 domain-containing protein n=1 Tax=Agrobacterium radiobacter TaxID=362 RepID=A0ABD5LKQ6_AGRRD
MCRFCEQRAFGSEEHYNPQLRYGGFVPGANMAPDLILCDGSILTMDPSRPEATAVAIRQGIIQAVGTTDEVLACRGRATRVVRLEGRALVPGFIASGVRLPNANGDDELERWVMACARAGFTTVDVTDLGARWEIYDAISLVIGRRHRLRLRGAVRDDLVRDWADGDLSPGQGNDLICIDAVRLRPSEGAAHLVLASALKRRSEGWRVVLDCLGTDDLECALEIASLTSNDELADVRLLMPWSIDEEMERRLTISGLHLVPTWGLAPVERLSGSAEQSAAAMHSLIVEMAHLAGVEIIVGEIRRGLYADFTVLNRSPYSVGQGPIKVLATWIEGVRVRLDDNRALRTEGDLTAGGGYSKQAFQTGGLS